MQLHNLKISGISEATKQQSRMPQGDALYFRSFNQILHGIKNHMPRRSGKIPRRDIDSQSR